MTFKTRICSNMTGLALIGAFVLAGCESDAPLVVDDAGVTESDTTVLDTTQPDDVVVVPDTEAPELVEALPCEGACDENESCIDEACVPSYCPPAGPYGTHPGDTLTDVVVKDCDGNDVHIHELCGAKAGYFNLLAGW